MRITVEELCGIQNAARRSAVWPWKKLLAELRGCAEVAVANHEHEIDHTFAWKQLREAVNKAGLWDRENP